MFGNRIRELRTEQGLSLRELAAQINISFTTLGNYEREDRQPDFDTLETIADFFNVRVDWLLGRTDIKTFDDYVYLTDVHHLGEQIQYASPEVRKLAVSIIDKAFLLIYHEVKGNNTELLKIFHDIYKQLWKTNLDLKHAMPVNDTVKSFSIEKTKLNNSLDELLQYYLSNQKDH